MEPEKITFPCDYPIKVVARSSQGLRERLDEIFAGHFGAFDALRVSVRESSQANFIAFTYLMRVDSIEQLSAVHAALQKHEGIVMVI